MDLGNKFAIVGKMFDAGSEEAFLSRVLRILKQILTAMRWKRIFLFAIGSAETVVGHVMSTCFQDFLAANSRWLIRQGNDDIRTSIYSNVDELPLNDWFWTKVNSYLQDTAIREEVFMGIVALLVAQIHGST